MSRRLKVLGLCLAAAMALTGVMATTASAVTHDPAKFTLGGTPWTVNDVQSGVNKITVTGQTLTCAKAELNGAGEGTEQTEIALEAVYAECKSEPLGVNATITGFGKVGEAGKCWYVFKASGGWELKCNGGEVTWTAATCQVHIPAQAVASGLTYTTETLPNGRHDLLIHSEITNIKANHTDGFLCPFGSGGNSETTVFEGTTTQQGFTSGPFSTDITWDPTQNTP